MYKAAVIGLGKIGAQFEISNSHSFKGVLNHSDCYLAHHKFTLTAGVDPSFENREYFKQKYNLRTFQSVQDLLQFDSPDVVSICSPSNLHAKHLNEVLDFGVKMIWVEKPVALTVEEHESLRQKIKKYGATVLVSFQRRYLNSFNKLKDIISNNILGNPIRMQIVYSKSLVTNGCHLMDAACYLMDDKCIHFDKITLTNSCENPSFQFFIDTLPVSVVGVDVDYHCLDLSLIFEKGRITIGQNSMESCSEIRDEHEYFPGYFRLKTDKKCLLPRENFRESFYAALDDLVNAFEQKREPISNMSTSIESQKLIEQVIAHSRDELCLQAY